MRKSEVVQDRLGRWRRNISSSQLDHPLVLIAPVMRLREVGRGAVRLAESTRNLQTLGRALRRVVTLHIVRESWHEARSDADQFVETAAGIDQPYAVACRAWVLAKLGEATAAMECIREGERLVEHQAANGIVSGHDWAYPALGHASLLLGSLDEAQRLGRCSAKSALSINVHGLDLLGHIAAHPERLDPEAAERCFREVVALATPRGLRPLIASAHLGLGTLFYLTDRSDEARRALETATSLYREMEISLGLQTAKARLAKLGGRALDE